MNGHRPRVNGRAVEYARVIAPLLPVYPEKPCHTADIMAMSGLTKAQVWEGIAWMKDHRPELPITSNPRLGYLITCDPETVGDTRRERAHYAYTHMRRLYEGTIVPYMRETLTLQESAFVTRQFSRLLEDIAAVTS